MGPTIQGGLKTGLLASVELSFTFNVNVKGSAAESGRKKMI